MKRIIDASALLAYLQGEKGAEAAKQYCIEGVMSAVNLSEVFQKAIPHKGTAIVQAIIQQAAIEIVPFSKDQARVAAELHQKTAGKGISFADRACLSLGVQLELPVVTADRQWKEVDAGVELIFFRS